MFKALGSTKIKLKFLGLPVIGDLKSKGLTRGSSLSKRRTFIVEKEDGPDMIYLFRLALPPLSGSYSPLFEGKVFPFRYIDAVSSSSYSWFPNIKKHERHSRHRNDSSNSVMRASGGLFLPAISIFSLIRRD